MKKLASLVGVSALLLASAGIVSARGGRGGSDIEVFNSGSAMQMITTTADADSGDISFEVERNYHFGEIEFNGGNYSTGEAVAVSTTEAIANQFTTRVHAGRQEAEVKNFGFASQFLRTDADADSGEVEMEVEHNAHFHEIELGGRGSVATGATLADSYTGAWANIFNTTIRH